jgi:hypothetical protein
VGTGVVLPALPSATQTLTIFQALAILRKVVAKPHGEAILDLNHGTSIALAVSALLAASGCSGGTEQPAGSSSAPIKCDGGNACQGLSECTSLDGKSSCVGENACKGLGYVYTQTQAQCDALKIRNKP